MNRIDRLVAMILLLQSKRSITADEIASSFEISVRTVYRDVTALGEAGVPIIAEAGIGYSLMKGYHLPPVMFTQKEALALATGGVLVDGFTDPALQNEMRSALLKVSAVMPQPQRDSLTRISGSTSFYPQKPPRHPPGSVAEIPLLQQALIEQRVLSLHYKDAAGNTSKRLVEPIELAFYLEKWHLLAWCRLRQDNRDFRLDRVTHLDILEETYPLSSRHSSDSYIKDCTTQETQQTVQVKFKRWAIDRVDREWLMGGERMAESDDWVEMKLNTGELDWLVNWLLSFGTSAEIIAPHQLKTLLTQQAERLAQHHQQ